MIINILGLWAAMAFSPLPTHNQPLVVACTVSDVERLLPTLTAQQVCDRLVQQMSQELKRPVQLQSDDPGTPAGEPVKINVRFEERTGAIAVVELYREGSWLKSPNLSVSVMDRSMNNDDIDQLGRDIANFVSYD